FGTARVNHNAGLFHGHLFQLSSSNRMCVCRISADNKYQVSNIEIFDGVGSCTGPERALHPDGSRGVTYAGAAINTIGPYHRSDELLHQVVFLIGAAGRRYAGYSIWAVGSFYLGKFIGNEIISLIPGGWNKLAVFADKGGAQPVAMIVK